MNKLKRSLSLRSSKRHIPESVRPQIWENDSYKVRNGGVSFPVKYVGSIEVTESRGTQVCAEAFRKMKEAGVAKKKRMQLLVTADCVRVVDEQTKLYNNPSYHMNVHAAGVEYNRNNQQRLMLLDPLQSNFGCSVTATYMGSLDWLTRQLRGQVFCTERAHKSLVIDQTIEKVSFCTPDPSNDRVFSYICREGTTRRWMCHSFIAMRDTGERLSHAVGCAFTACLQRKQKAQALQQQHKEQQSSTGAVTPSAATTTPLVNGTSVSNPSPQQPSLGKTTTPAQAPTIISTSLSTGTTTSSPISSTAPIAADERPSSVSTSQVKNGSVVGLSTQPLPSPGQPQPKQANTAAPLLKPPPTVARPRPQPFNPSPFTRHMSLRYRSNPLSFMPLRGETSGYETLTEEPTVPQLPPTVDALVPQSTTPAVADKSTLQPTVQHSTPSQPGNMYNGLSANPSTAPASSTLLKLSQAAPLQPYAVPPASSLANGSVQWNTTGQPQPQLPSQSQRPRKLSEAEVWLATASADTTTSGGMTARRNQGLLTTINPFAETASQIDALSNAWTHDLQISTNSSTQPANTSWASSPWAQSSASSKSGNDEFASYFASRQMNPPVRQPLTKRDSNPFKPENQDQIFWV